MLKTASTKSC